MVVVKYKKWFNKLNIFTVWQICAEPHCVAGAKHVITTESFYTFSGQQHNHNLRYMFQSSGGGERHLTKISSQLQQDQSAILPVNILASYPQVCRNHSLWNYWVSVYIHYMYIITYDLNCDSHMIQVTYRMSLFWNVLFLWSQPPNHTMQDNDYSVLVSFVLLAYRKCLSV